VNAKALIDRRLSMAGLLWAGLEEKGWDEMRCGAAAFGIFLIRTIPPRSAAGKYHSAPIKAIGIWMYFYRQGDAAARFCGAKAAGQDETRPAFA
jgi:hypothetical protein